MLAGYDGTGPVTQLRRNNSGVFVNVASGLPDVERCALAWADCDTDGDVDLAISGVGFDLGFVTQLKRNDITTPNTSPSAPSSLTASLTGSTATFSWLAASDPRTPVAGLTYNLMVGTTPGGSNILGPQANTANGFRLLPAPGNTQSGLNHKLKNLPNGIYYWSVQAVDTSFQGGPFAANSVFAAGSTLTASQLWRFKYFGTLENTGSAADLADPEGDGLVNLLEFATDSNPLTFSPPVGQLVKIGSDLEFTYTRPVSALTDVNYRVEASAILSGTWIPVTSAVISNNGITQVVKAVVPLETGMRFVRLRVTRL